MQRTKRVPLVEASLRLGVAYGTVRDRIARGELVGGRDEFGRWFVELSEQSDDKTRASAPEPSPAA